MDLKQSLELVGAQAVKAATPAFVRHPAARPNEAYLCVPGTPPVLVSARAPMRRYGSGSLQGLVEQVLFLAGTTKDKVAVFVDDQAVVAVVGEDERQDRVTFSLQWSEAYKLLSGGTMQGIDQKQLVWLLRTTLKGLVKPESFLPTIRQVRFKSASDGESKVQTGSESISRSVMRELVFGDAEPDEEITVRAPVFVEPDVTFDFTVAIDVDLSEQTFTLKVVGDQIQERMREAVVWTTKEIRERCKPAANVVVFEASRAE